MLVRIDSAGATVALTMQRPDRANAMNAELVEALLSVFESESALPSGTRLVVLRGSGSTFCSGFDFGDLEQQSDGDLLLRFVRIETLLQRIVRAPFLTIALAHGRALGVGADLFAACTIRIAAPGTLFRFPGWRFGLALGTARLIDRIGADAAREVLLEATTIDVEQARSLGLVTTVAGRGAWDDLIAQQQARLAATSLDVPAFRQLVEMSMQHADRSTTADGAALAALAQTASRPGLRDRIARFRRDEAARQHDTLSVAKP
jgi:enoyl-CoA hydratase